MLPVDLLAEILSRTSPVDALRFAVLSKGFKSAAESDNVWDRFLPSDWSQIVSRSVSPVVYNNVMTKKELYFSLCHSPILLDGGNLSFCLDKRSGNKCYMVAARELVIAWRDSIIPMYWEWPSHPDARFSEVAAQHLGLWWLDIRGKINTRMLSSNTRYGAYLVFKLAERFYGLKSANAVVRFVDEEDDSNAEERAGVVHLQLVNAHEQTGQLPVRRSDGWMEVELGDFYNDEGDNGEVEARLIEIKLLHGKRGLIVEGIEFRPRTPQFGS